MESHYIRSGSLAEAQSIVTEGGALAGEGMCNLFCLDIKE